VSATTRRPSRALRAKTARALALFDIDGTLLRRAGPHHRMALVEAIRRATGLTTSTDAIPLYGMLDPVIVAEMLRRAGAPEPLIREAMPEVIRHAQSIYVRSCPNLERKTCPGVRRALERLARADIALGLVTGNLTRIGWKKMERAGLRRYFRLGAFGEMAENRAGLVRLAAAEAVERGLVAPEATVSLVGDAPSDILAAQAAGVRSIAVSTGVRPPEELRAYSPDYLLDDLRALRPEMLL
jgi:phosphoglycolate phosphatase-like HAD superfamily hydrolase